MTRLDHAQIGLDLVLELMQEIATHEGLHSP
jgi:hypothetical protein